MKRDDGGRRHRDREFRTGPSRAVVTVSVALEDLSCRATMLAAFLERTFCGTVVLGVPVDAAWIVPILGAVVGFIALATAWMNRRTALVARDKQRAELLSVASVAAAPGVLLPPRLPRFVNRADAIEQAVAQIRAGERVVAIEGGAGVGKSAVATELAHRLRCDDVDDGVSELRTHDFVWIDGRDSGPTLADICQQITLLTGEQALSAVAGDAKLQALRAHLARKRTVLLLDNITMSPQPSIDSLQDLLGAVPHGSLVIASVNSSHVLHAPTRLVLEELEPRHALELIAHETERLGLTATGLFDAALVARLQNAVGGNPRLIESFLRAVTSSPASVGDLLEALERGEGLSELFLGVWDELQQDARALLSACAYLRGQAVVAQLEVACDLERSEVSAGLTELMRVGLATVVRSAGRPDVFSCSSAVARFVIAEAPEQLIAVFTERLSAHYIRQFSREPENAAWAVAHVAGIMAVLQWTYDGGDDDANLQALFSSVLDVLFTLGLFDDRIVAGRLAYESAIRASNYRAASLATDVLSSTHAARGELESALEAVALGLVAAERSMDVGERARQMRAHALALYKGGDATAALAALEGADDLARQTGDLEILVNVLGLRTVACWWLGAVEDCEAAAEEGLRVCEEMAWRRASAYPLRNLAELAVHRGRFDRAEALLEQARAVAESFGDRRQLARIHLTSARLALFAGQPKRAAEEASSAHSAAVALGLLAELREAQAIGVAAARSRLLPPLGAYYSWRRPLRFTDAAIGGD